MKDEESGRGRRHRLLQSHTSLQKGFGSAAILKCGVEWGAVVRYKSSAEMVALAWW